MEPPSFLSLYFNLDNVYIYNMTLTIMEIENALERGYVMSNK